MPQKADPKSWLITASASTSNEKTEPPRQPLSDSSPNSSTKSGDKEPPASIQPWYGSRRWGPVLAALIGLLGIVIPLAVTRCDEQPPSTPEPAFVYQVRVRAKDTDAAIDQATVTLELPGGKAPLHTVTDSTGLARLLVPSEYVKKPAVLIVESTDCNTYFKNLDLTEDALPAIILLEAKTSQ